MLIVGAQGFAKEILTVFTTNNYLEEIVLFDNVSPSCPPTLFDKYRILRTDVEARKYLRNVDERFVLGIGNPHLRYKLYEKFIRLGGIPYNLVSKYALIGELKNVVKDGTCILSKVIIEADNFISEGCLIHVGVFISHDTKIGKFCELSPFVKLLGKVEVGDFCQLGTGSIILPKVKLGNNVIVGAGAVVTKDVPDNTTVVGIPAKSLIK